MKVAVAVLLIAFACVNAVPKPNHLSSHTNPELNAHWELFKSHHKKQYDSQFEFVRRLIWESNLKYIQQHNLEFDMGKHNYGLGMNEFGDLTFEEFRAMYLGYKMSLKNNQSKHDDTVYMSPMHLKDLPDTVDWRSKQIVTPVKNQGQCGSCWSFSTTGSLEGQYARKTGKLVSFSEQQLVDCSGKYGNQGCNGGLMDNAFDYIKKYGIETENDYPYQARQQTCKIDSSEIVTKDTGFVDIPAGDEDKLKEAVATVGPVSVAIDASHMSFQFYRHGVYDERRCSSTALDHGVLAVGYGTENQEDYWLVKNSWGPTWGDHGYIKMSRNNDNQCGIATKASYPLL